MCIYLVMSVTQVYDICCMYYILMEYMCNVSQPHSTLAQDDEEDLLYLHGP